MQNNLLLCIETGYNIWNNTLQIIISILSVNPESISGGAPYQLVNAIYTPLLSVGYTILVLSYLLSVAHEVTDVRQLRRPEWIVMSLFRLLVAQAIMANGLTLLRGIYAFVIDVLQLVSGHTLQLQPMQELSDEVRTTITSLNLLESTGLILIAILFLILMIGASIFIIVTVYLRFCRLFMLMSMAPLFLGTLGGGVLGGTGLSRSGQAYLQNHVSVCMEGIGLVISCLIYSAFVGGGLPHILSNASQGMGAVFEYLANACLQAVMLCMMIKLVDHMMQSLVKFAA